MSKQIIPNYTFDASAGTVALTDFPAVRLERFLLITNVTTGTIIYNFTDPTKGGSTSGNALLLDTDTTGMTDDDDLQVLYDVRAGDPQYERAIIGNARSKFRDGFSGTDNDQPDPEIWDLEAVGADGHIINQGGNSGGSSYLRISLSPFVEGSEVCITSREAFTFPMRLGFGVSTSQRMSGQEVFFGVVGLDEEGNVDKTAEPADLAITGPSIVIASNVGTVTIANHGLQGGDRLNIFGCAEHRLNVGPVVATIIDANTFTVPITLANGSYSAAGGTVRHISPVRGARNAVGYLLENTNAAQASFVSRRNGSKYRSANTTVATTTAVQANTSGYTDSFNAASTHELQLTLDEVSHRSFPSDSNASMSGSGKYSQGIPDEEVPYKLHIRARNLTGLTRPIARILTATKSGTTTATIVTDVPHGLAAGDYVQTFGIRDVTNFPQLAAQTAVASVVNPTTFTIVIGTAATASSTGGIVFRNEGSVLASYALSGSVQSVARSNNVLIVTFNSAVSTPLPGEYWHLWGLDPALSALEGGYKVLRNNGSTVELEASGADVAAQNTGGGFMRRTDVRVHFVRVIDYTRLVTEISGGRGNGSDTNNAVPVVWGQGATINTNATSTQNASSSTSGGYGKHRLISVAGGNATLVRSSGARLYRGIVYNLTTSNKFMKLYNSATAPTLGSGTPAETHLLEPGPNILDFGEIGDVFATGLGYTLTTGVADNDTTGVGAGEVIVHLYSA